MHEDSFNEFDQLLRSKLQDAEVKAPRGAWKAVCGRLDQEAAAASAASSSWWKWAGASLAMAAALAAGLFFSGTFGSTPNVEENAVAILTNSNNSNQEALTAQALTLEPVAEEPVITPAVPAKEKAPKHAVAPVSEAAPAAEEPVIAEEQPAVKEEAPAEVATTVPAKKENKTGKTPATAPMSEADAWAAIALEDSQEHFKPRVALALEGTLGGNDSDILVRSSRTGHMSSGTTSIKKTGISESSTSNYGIPLSFGLGVRVHFTPSLSVGTGLDYTLLSRTFEGTYNEVADGMVVNTADGDIFHTMQYIGIPINLYYDILKGDRLKFYVYGGGEAEFCVSNRYTIDTNPGSILFNDPVKGLQYSVGAGLGVEFRLGRNIGLYLDPGVNYYFHCDQPKNVRTEHPLMFNFEAGLRFNVGR